MKHLALFALLSLTSCQSTKVTSVINNSDGKTVTETTSQKFDTPSFLEILGGITKATGDFIGFKKALDAPKQ